MWCVACQSIWHLLNKCCNRYKNLRKFCNNVPATFEDGTNKKSYITNLNKAMRKAELEDVALITGDKQKIPGLGGETLGSILDCRCFTNVARDGMVEQLLRQPEPGAQEEGKDTQEQQK